MVAGGTVGRTGEKEGDSYFYEGQLLFIVFFVVVVSALDMNDWAERTPEKEANSLILKPFSKEPLYLNCILISIHSWRFYPESDLCKRAHS